MQEREKRILYHTVNEDFSSVSLVIYRTKLNIDMFRASIKYNDCVFMSVSSIYNAGYLLPLARNGI